MGKAPPKLRVLVVDDEPLIRWSIADVLVRNGHAVVEASDARSAVTLLAAPDSAVDVVLLDLRLPDSHDLSLLRRVRTLAPHSAVVMMTAHRSREMLSDVRAMGVFDVMDKPFDMHALEQVVMEAHAHRPTDLTPSQSGSSAAAVDAGSSPP